MPWTLSIRQTKCYPRFCRSQVVIDMMLPVVRPAEGRLHAAATARDDVILMMSFLELAQPTREFKIRLVRKS